MQRSIIGSSALRSTRLLINQTSKRSFSSASSRTTSESLSRWILPTSIMAIGLSSYYITQPLFLDTKKETKEAKPEAEAPKAPEDGEKKEGEEGEQQQAAYNPETGEINWDCPCLGGMAHGPCGEEFKEAFSCFVYSEADPKGFDCIEKFKNMQNCFRKYPDVYSEEIRDEENTPVDTTESAEQVSSEPTKTIESESPAAVSEPLTVGGADVNPVMTEHVPTPVTKE